MAECLIGILPGLLIYKNASAAEASTFSSQYETNAHTFSVRGADGALFNHNFRTMIIDASGRLQMTFPIGGNLSDAIVAEILKASVVKDGSPTP
jgi:hypothetical protein